MRRRIGYLAEVKLVVDKLVVTVLAAVVVVAVVVVALADADLVVGV